MKIEKESEVFLVDHAWTFRYQDAIETLKQQPQLAERLSKAVEDVCKMDLPGEEESKGKTVEEAFAEANASGGKAFDLDHLKIASIKKLPPLPETTEELSFFGNQIEDPNDIADILVPLPNLRALWLNDNPVVDACANFNTIAELMPKLEIINSQLTAKAGEWAVLFYARDSGAKELDQIEALDLSGKGILYMSSIEVFQKMTKLRKLDISDHSEFFMTQEKQEAEQVQALQGIKEDVKEKVEFAKQNITIHDILPTL